MWQASLTGNIRLSGSAFERLVALRVEDAALLDRLVDHRYDLARQVFSFQTWSSRLCASGFHVLLASLKDLPGVDEIRQIGPTYDAWFDTGVFFLRPGAWAYVGEGPEHWNPSIVGPVEARVEDVLDDRWQVAPPLVRAVRLADDSCLAVDWWNAPTTHVSRWSFPPLCGMDDEAVGQGHVRNGGLQVAWGDAVVLLAENLWNAREETDTRRW